eukprot:gene10586-14221_t
MDTTQHFVDPQISLLLKESKKVITEEKYYSLINAISLGDYLHVLTSFEFSNTSLDKDKLLMICNQNEHEATFLLREAVLSYLSNNSISEYNEVVFKSLLCLILGISYMELFCQANYSGPELSSQAISNLISPTVVADTNELHKYCIQHLECDGNYAFSICEIPHCLLIARILLATIADPTHLTYKSGVKLNESGSITSKLDQTNDLIFLSPLLNNQLHSKYWWNARCSVLHLRALQDQSYEHNPTLWKETSDMFKFALAEFCSYDESLEVKPVELNSTKLLSSPNNYLAQSNISASLKAQLWIEWGLACHFFAYGDKGKQSFNRAKEVANLEVKLTAAMGKRTKYQHTAYAQLLLFAKSSLLLEVQQENVNNSDSKQASTINQPSDANDERQGSRSGAPNKDELVVKNNDNNDDVNNNNYGDGGWKHAEWELGKRLVTEASNGEEVAVREVMLDSIDGGPAENIILEGGPKFSDNEVDRGGLLHSVDQAIILALCLDVSNSNPIDGLTNEEMYPYVERVLNHANNWMIHSTALLERSWLEYERRKTMDRALLQIQALLDQHTTKLTMMQSTIKSINDSAPVNERLKYLYCIVYPAQYELKRDLAYRYLRCQVFVSALNLFKELELWDDVVTCYQLLQKPTRAELVVREQLKHNTTPYMLTSLADLTGKEEYYEQAWTLSKHRYPRAKRTLGKICYDRKDYQACCQHMDAALSVQPLVATAWYLKGIACMQLSNWDEGIQAFVRCVQQDMEIGEAWGNIGAIHMKLKNWAKAHHALTESYKTKRESWRIVENLMMVTISMGRWREVMLHMNTLLDMRNKSERPVHVDELRHVCFIVSAMAQKEEKVGKSKINSENTVINNDMKNIKFSTLSYVKQQKLDEDAIIDENEEDEDNDIIPIAVLTDLPKIVAQFLDKVTNTIKAEAIIYEIYAEFNTKLGRFREALDNRVKQVRSLLIEPNWEKSLPKVHIVTEAAQQLVDCHKFNVTEKSDLYQCKSLLTSILKKVEIVFKSSRDVMIIDDLILRIDEVYASFTN